jgi:Sec-independent protein translocase protein TatA
MIDVIVTILILYLLYKFVFDFVVPVSRTTSHFKNQVNEMRRQQEQMYKQQQQNAQQNTNTSFNKNNTTTTDGEYIDFEEVK